MAKQKKSNVHHASEKNSDDLLARNPPAPSAELDCNSSDNGMDKHKKKRGILESFRSGWLGKVERFLADLAGFG